MSYKQVIKDIEELPHYREFVCGNCGYKQQVYALFVQTRCEKCSSRHKLRGYASLGSEIEDVIDAVLDWLGEGQEFDLAMERKRIIDSDNT